MSDISSAVDRFVGIRSSSAPAFTTDGKTLLHLSDESGMAQLWALDLATGRRRRLTNEDEKVAFFSRSPVDDRVIYGIDRGGDERQQLKLLRADGGTVALTDAPAVIHSFGAWAPDGTAIAFTANARDEAQFDAHVMDLATRSVRSLYRGDGMCTILGWSPKGTKLLLLEERSSADMELHVIDLAMDRVTVVPRPSKFARYQSARWRPDGTAFYVCTDSGRDWLGAASIDAVSLDLRWLHTPEHDVEALALAPDGKTIAMVGNIDGYSQLAMRDATTGAAVDTSRLPRGRIGELTWAPDGKRLALALGTARTPFDIWLWRAEDGGATQVTHSDRAGFAPDTLADAELIRFPTFDDRAIPGFLFLPPEPAPTGGRKAVIWVHGGPESQSRPSLHVDVQLMVSRGCAVLVPNVRGSTGYGRAYAALDDVALRMDSVRDLRHAALWLGARPDIDARRIAVMGQSYGGFMVLAALTEYPELWAAGIEYYGIADFHTMLAGTGPWRRGHRAREYGDPVSDAELLTRISPIRKAERIAVPLLVTHGKRDPRVPPGESEQIVGRLRQLGKTVEYLTFDYAGHGYVRPEHRRDVHRAVVDFLERHV
ncbi:MAG: S9 family peptidase [Proteobacteria bacterium]|nr:S9 family peptidase [Pseudomonadota bacterium]